MEKKNMQRLGGGRKELSGTKRTWACIESEGQRRTAERKARKSAEADRNPHWEVRSCRMLEAT